MRVSAIRLQSTPERPAIELRSIAPGLTAIYGPVGAGKSAVAQLVGHALFGRTPNGTTGLSGEVIVDDDRTRYRMRRRNNSAGQTRLTVAAVDGTHVDQTTIQRLVGGLTPAVLAPLCAPSFRNSNDATELLSASFAHEFQRLCGEAVPNARRVTELTARRDLLAQELESRIADDRRTSKELETRWRVLDRHVRDKQEEATALEQRLRASEAALVETDTRLRYRRLELNTELRWHSDEPPELEQHVVELDTQIERCRRTIAEQGDRETSLRTRLAQVQAAPGATTATIRDQQLWLSVARQLTADLNGEVSRLARASASQKCVCHDAHPRLRPIAETIERQLGVLESLINEQRRLQSAAEIEAEVGHLARSQAELRRQLEHLLSTRQTATHVSATVRHDAGLPQLSFGAADAEQLESRRMELEHDRFRLVEQLRLCSENLQEHRAERDAIERQRAALLSVRSIEHVQRELAAVQHKIEQTSTAPTSVDYTTLVADSPARASDFLAQLTGGDLSRVSLVSGGRSYCVLKYGQTVPATALTPAERDQVHLSLSLALVSEAARRGVWLPLVLDEPFERLDARGAAALAAVLGDFCRHGHQVIVFTARQDATDRFASLGAAIQDIRQSRRVTPESTERRDAASMRNGAPPLPTGKKIKRRKRVREREEAPHDESHESVDDAPNAGRSDAA